MKRIRILFFLVAILIFSLSIGNEVKASSLIRNEDSPSALGKTINCVTAKSYGNLSTGYVLDRDYYDSIGYDVNIYDKKAECRYYTETSRENVKYNFNTDYSMESSVDGTLIKNFTYGASSKFSSVDSNKEEIYVSRSFSEFIGEVDYSKYYIGNFCYKQNEYKQHLSLEYLNALNDLSLGKISYEKLFNDFGTHLIGNYAVGDRLYIDTFAMTNDVKIDASFSASIASEISAKVSSINGDSKTVATVFEEYGLTETNSYFGALSYTASSILVSVNGIERIDEAIDKWANETSLENATITGFDSNGLMPLWEFLPDNSPISPTEMKNAFIKYALDNERTYSYSSYDPFSEISGTVNFRSGENNVMDVEDCDRFDNVDNFRINTNFKLSMVKSAYKKLEINVTCDVYKKEKGNRYIYIYTKDAVDNKKYDNYLCQFDVSISKKKTWYSNRSYTATIDISNCSNFVDLNLAIVWRASGSGDDTWRNRNTSVSYRLYN